VIELVLSVALAKSTVREPGRVPDRGVLVPGKSLAGVELGDTPSRVRARWGTGYRVCGACVERTWYYTLERAGDDPLGVGVSFRRGGVSAVFTLGSPRGWRTSEGLRLGDAVGRADALYGTVSWKDCIGYVALSMRRGGVVTSIYTTGDSVYGFALTRVDEPVCQ
jgi:hypothetical protein